MTREVKIGPKTIGAGHDVLIQSMTNTDSTDVQATLSQIDQLAAAGCAIVRLAVPNQSAARSFAQIKKHATVPLVADIHFDSRLALAAIEAGADKIRVNPGNIGGNIAEIARESERAGIPIRIGVNSGSLDPDVLSQHGRTPLAMVKSAERYINLFNQHNFDNLVISLKSSNPLLTVQACRMFAEQFDYPQHLGVTETGPAFAGSIKSAVGIGALLLDGIGDTIRVSLTTDPVEEIPVAREILKAAGRFRQGVNIISCPTCGRCKIDLINLVKEVESKTRHITKPLTIAIMGCSVNGPGEAKEADFGIAGNVLFRHGEIIRQVEESDLIAALLNELQNT